MDYQQIMHANLERVIGQHDAARSIAAIQSSTERMPSLTLSIRRRARRRLPGSIHR
jgi:hypothetical protein